MTHTKGPLSTHPLLADLKLQLLHQRVLQPAVANGATPLLWVVLPLAAGCASSEQGPPLRRTAGDAPTERSCVAFNAAGDAAGAS